MSDSIDILKSPHDSFYLNEETKSAEKSVFVFYIKFLRYKLILVWSELIYFTSFLYMDIYLIFISAFHRINNNYALNPDSYIQQGYYSVACLNRCTCITRKIINKQQIQTF